MICRLEELVELAQKNPPTRVAIAAAAHNLVLESVRRAVDLGLIVPVLVGREADIRTEAGAIGWDLKDIEIVPTETNKMAATVAVELVRQGKVKVLMKGYLHTDEMLHAVLKQDTGLRTDRLLSHVFVMEVPTYHKLLLITDAINIRPGSCKSGHYAERGRPGAQAVRCPGSRCVIGRSTQHFVRVHVPAWQMAEQGRISTTSWAADSDIATAARDKGIVSPVSGDADVVVVPDLDSGNILSKNLEYLASAKMAGIVMGALAPVVLTSRSDPPGARVYSLALASLL
jgi:phosphotransacetylase